MQSFIIDCTIAATAWYLKGQFILSPKPRFIMGHAVATAYGWNRKKVPSLVAH